MKSAKAPTEWPKLSYQTNLVAIVGRSNVGKSTLINELCQQKGLAKTSSTPGKTQLLNFFFLHETLVLVDLPGYGFAKVPKELKVDWGKTITTFLERAVNLDLVLFLLDIRRMPSEEDLQLLEWLAHNQKECLIVFTKADKLSKSDIEIQTRAILELLPYEGMEYVVHSSKTHLGTNDLRQRIEEYVAIA